MLLPAPARDAHAARDAAATPGRLSQAFVTVLRSAALSRVDIRCQPGVVRIFSCAVAAMSSRSVATITPTLFYQRLLLYCYYALGCVIGHGAAAMRRDALLIDYAASPASRYAYGARIALPALSA